MRSPFLLACVAAVLAGCTAGSPPRSAPRPAGESLRIADEDLDRDPREVSGADAALDLDVAVRAFDEAYAGVDGAPRLPSPERIAAARARLAAAPRWSPEALVELLAELLRQPDGHLAFGWGGRSPLRLEAWPSAAPPAPRRGTAVTLVPGAVPRLVVRTFDSAAAAELARLPALARKLRDLPAFVIDLRGNGGGNFELAERFVLELTSATLHRLDEREVVSVAAAEGRANRARRRLLLGEVPAEAAPLFHTHVGALDATAATLRERGSGRVERVAEGGAVRGRAPGPLRGRVVILVDGGCASACEMTVALARQIPGVVVAGEPTRGSMAAGEVALFRLPRSGLTISLGTRAFRDPTGSFVETRGFLPDVRIAGSDDAVARAEELAGGPPRTASAARTPPDTPMATPAPPPPPSAGPRLADGEHDSALPARVVSPAPTRVSSRK